MLSLLDKLSSPAPDSKEQAKQIKLQGLARTESEYNTTNSGTQQVTMDHLMSGISDTKGFRTLQKAFAPGDKKPSTTSAPVASVVSERAMRKVQYNHQKKEIRLWDKSVKMIRDADTLDFRPADKGRVNRADLVGKFEPSNDFENEMAALLERSGAKEDADVLRAEEAAMANLTDDLGESKLTMEELKKRQAELAKMRSLMFYEEQKRNKINKIKSKKYRKIRKKQNQRAKTKELEAAIDEDPELAREMEEKEEMKRMEERMSLSHKNTSKWAKQQLRRGAGLDKDTRQALSAQIKLGDDLRKKMNSIEGEDSDGDAGGAVSNDELVARARAVLEETKDDIDAAKGRKKSGGIHDMAFMKRGLEIQRERAKEEARKLLQELEDDASSGSNDQAEDTTENINDLLKLTTVKGKASSASETAKVLPRGKFVASQLEFSNSNSVSVSGGISIDMQTDITSSNNNNLDDGATIEIMAEKFDLVNEVGQNETKNTSKSTSSLNNNPRTTAIRDNAKNDANPWMKSVKNSQVNEKREGKKKIIGGVVDVRQAASMLDGGDEKEKIQGNNVDGFATKNMKNEGNATGTVNLSQAELVKKAFAAPTDEEVREEFEAEKDALRERDDPTRKKEEEKTVSGWGSWVGEGAPPPRPPKKLPKRLQAPEKKKQVKRRRDDELRTVIISEKRIKKNAQYCVDVVPYPYTSREQYEKAMGGALGREWNVTSAVKNMTRPEIVTRAGIMIKPISNKRKAKGSKRAPAKF